MAFLVNFLSLIDIVAMVNQEYTQARLSARKVLRAFLDISSTSFSGLNSFILSGRFTQVITSADILIGK